MSVTVINRFPQTEKELEVFIDNFQDKLVHYAFFKLGNREEAEDVVQEVIIKMYQERLKYKELENPAGYIFRMISNSCIDKIRKRQVFEINNKNISDEIITDYSKDCSSEIIQKEEYKRVTNILLKLPKEQAEVIEHRVINEMKFIEIAEILQVPTATVKSRFKYGINKLKSFYLNRKEVKHEL